MALQDLITRLEHDAEERVAQIRTRAGEEVRSIEQAAERSDVEKRRRAVEKARALRRAELDREIAAASQRARAAVLQAQYALLDRVCCRAGALSKELEDDGDYLAALPGQLAEALAFVEGEAAEVSCAPRIALLLGKNSAVRVVEDLSRGPGFVVIARGGSVRIDQTIAARMEREKAAFAIELMREIEP